MLYEVITVGPESFSFAGNALSSEFELMLQLLYHHLHDPAFRKDAFNRSRDSLQRMYRQLNNSVEGVQQIQGERFLAGTCPEFGQASWEEIATIRLEQIRSWLVITSYSIHYTKLYETVCLSLSS